MLHKANCRWALKIHKNIDSNITSVYRYIYLNLSHNSKELSMGIVFIQRFLKLLLVPYGFFFKFIQQASSRCPIGWGCRIHWLLLCWELRPPTMNVLGMIQNNLMVRILLWRTFGECRVPLHCHRSQVHSGSEWLHLIGSDIWVK